MTLRGAGARARGRRSHSQWSLSRSTEPLPREFFARDTEVVARDLLGVWLLRSSSDGLAGGPIVEVEAYGGPEDKASHTRAGRTKRTEPMFGEVGHAYVYLVYGMHNCLNVVAYREREAGAVLIRAIEPRVGVELMRARRGGRSDPDSRLGRGTRPSVPGAGCDTRAGRPRPDNRRSASGLRRRLSDGCARICRSVRGSAWTTPALAGLIASGASG